MPKSSAPSLPTGMGSRTTGMSSRTTGMGSRTTAGKPATKSAHGVGSQKDAQMIQDLQAEVCFSKKGPS